MSESVSTTPSRSPSVLVEAVKRRGSPVFREFDKKCREQLRQDRNEAFFASLPQDNFTDGELALREALLSFLHLRLQAHEGYPPAVYECSGSKGDPGVMARCRDALPSGVALRRWTDRRMGDEAYTSWDADRQCTVVSLIDCSLGPEIVHRADTFGSNVGYRFPSRLPRRGDPSAKEEKRQDDRDRFFESLPAEFTPEEERLRLAVLEFLETYELSNPWWPPSISEANSKKQVNAIQQCGRALLPTGTEIREWINHRISGEVQARWDEERQCTVLVWASG